MTDFRIHPEAGTYPTSNPAPDDPVAKLRFLVYDAHERAIYVGPFVALSVQQWAGEFAKEWNTLKKQFPRLAFRGFDVERISNVPFRGKLFPRPPAIDRWLIADYFTELTWNISSARAANPP